MNITRRVINALAMVLMTASLVRAQLPTATILGTVRDASGAVVPGASVAARNVDTGQSRSAKTAGDGSYRFSALPVGNYEVRVEHAGFQAAVRSGLTLTVSQEAVVNIGLEIGAATQTVSVSAEAPLVDTTSGSLGGTVDEQKVANLPLNGRNYIDLVLLQTGVNLDTNRPQGEATWYSSNGASVRSNYYTLDGTPTRNLYGTNPSSMTATALGVDGVREFKVITNSFSAEYGMAMGSQMVIVSKSGTNGYHGTLFEYLRNSALDARNFFDLSTDRRLPEFIRNQFGGSIGGPIQKNKTFFFGTWESLHERLGITSIVPGLPGAGCHGPAGATITQAACPQLSQDRVVSSVTAPLLALFPIPNLPGNGFTFPFSQPTLEGYTQERVDHNFTDKDTVFARFTGDWASRSIVQTFPQFFDNQKSQLYFITLAENHIFSPTLLNTGRASWSGTRLNTGGPLPFTGAQYSMVPGLPMGQINLLGNTFGPDSPIPLYENQYIWSYSDDVFYTRGKHSMKVGALVNQITQEPVGPAGLRGTVSFQSLDNFLLGIPQNYSAITPGSNVQRKYHNGTYGFYFQDDIRVTSRFTLNLGLRYEFNTVPREVNGIEASLRDRAHDATQTPGPIMLNTSLHNFGPRFGFAWDVFGDGKTAIRGGWSQLYDISNIGSGLITIATGQPPFSSRSAVTNAGAVLTLPLFFPASAVGKNLQLIDYDLQQPSMRQYNLTVERQLPGHIGMSLAYAGSHGWNIVRNTEGNPVIPQGIPVNGACAARPAGQAVNLDAPNCWLSTDVGNNLRINPNWTNMGLRTANSKSWYNSLQFALNRRFGNSVQFQSSYTYSKSIDQIENQLGSDQVAGESSGQTDPLHNTIDQARSGFDATHNWRFNAMYHAPSIKSGGVAAALLNGWWFSGIASVQTGAPFTACLPNNQSKSGTGGCTDRPNLVPGRTSSDITSGTTKGCPGVTAGQQLGTPTLFFDPCAFSLQPAGFLGTAGRNILTGPGLANLDFSAVKDTHIPHLGEQGILQFRAEIFNILNHANFGFSPLTNADRVVSPGTFNAATGVLIQTATPSRQIQFALKLMF